MTEQREKRRHDKPRHLGAIYGCACGRCGKIIEGQPHSYDMGGSFYYPLCSECWRTYRGWN